jgi:hypothetical protein
MSKFWWIIQSVFFNYELLVSIASKQTASPAAVAVQAMGYYEIRNRTRFCSALHVAEGNYQLAHASRELSRPVVGQRLAEDLGGI